MQIDGIEKMADLLLHGGDTGALLVASGVIIWAIKKLSRDETLKRDYPPHRHSNGKILYPSEYPPPPMERLN